ncbi:DJ-1/PfpI family protein [Paraherbaspirillum soli]|uniref:DJ-1/PfpI family protein n=1 Tax=Paraherbaspirillum soli TaxID=631222 RepID=A0ABW0ME32_9BURK
MLSVGILVFDDVEILDFSGPYEVFSTAARVHGRTNGHADAGQLFRCFLVAASMRPIRTRGGMLVLPDCVLPPVADIDVLLVPGGDVSVIRNNDAVIAWIAEQSRSTEIIASVCTGAFLLAKAGVLDGLDVTTHWEDLDELQSSFPKLTLQRDVAWVDCGKVLTSGGISAGVDMSLHLVARLAGRPLATATAKQMEYRWLQ